MEEHPECHRALEKEVQHLKERLTEVEEILRAIADAMSEGAAILTSDGVITYCNHRFAEFLRMPLDTLIGSSMRNYVAMDYVEAFDELVTSCSIGACKGEVELVAADGTRILVLMVLGTLKMAETVGVSMVILDLAERKKAEATRARLAALVESTQDAVLAMTLEGIVTDWNRSAERIYGYSAGEIIGKHLSTLIPTNHRAEMNMILATVAQGEGVGPFETQRVRKDGRIIDVQLSVSPVKDVYNNIIGIAKITRDITDRRNVERAREATRVALDQIYEREHRIAETFQRAFLPQTLPPVPGYDLASAYEPALIEAAVGGDIFDVYWISDSKLGIAICDVSGKGLMAAKYTAMSKYSLRAYSFGESDPGKVLSMLNTILNTDLAPEMFITSFFGVLDVNTGRLNYANAGHEPPLLITVSGDVLKLDVTGMIIGVYDRESFDTSSVDLHTGDTLVLYTDGVTDAHGMEPALGQDGLEQLLKTRGCLRVDRVVATILDEVKRRSGDKLADDVAILAIQAV